MTSTNGRAAQRARNMAVSDLIEAHRKEYERLLAHARESLGLPSDSKYALRHAQRRVRVLEARIRELEAQAQGRVAS